MKPESINDIVGSDRNHLWHHLVQHKPWQSADPMVIVEGKGMRGRVDRKRRLRARKYR